MRSHLLIFITITIAYSFLLKNIQSYFPFDHPSERKQHEKPITLLGGLILSLSFIIISFHILPNWFILGAFVTIITGFIDDKINLHWIIKILIQLLLLIFISFKFWNQFNLLLFYNYSIPVNQIILFLLFLFWFIGIYNAINLIDGLDGLAAGFMVILCTAASFLGSPQFKELNLLFVICAMPFLVFNQRPAKTFMGDSGSLFLGYFLATLPLLYYDLQSSAINILDMTPFVILVSFLIADTTRVFFTRIISGKSPMTADTIHFHHMIIQRSGSYLGTLFTIMAVSSISAFFAIINNGLVIFDQTGLIIHLSIIFLFVLTPPAPAYTKLISNIIESIYTWDKKINKKLSTGGLRSLMMGVMLIALVCSIFYNSGFEVLLSWKVLLANLLLFIFIYIKRDEKHIIYIIQVFITILLLELCWGYSLNIFEKLLIIFQLFSFVVFTLQNVLGTKINHYSALDILLFYTILIASFLAIFSFNINIWILYAIASCWITIGFIMRRTTFRTSLN